MLWMPELVMHVAYPPIPNRFGIEPKPTGYTPKCVEIPTADGHWAMKLRRLLMAVLLVCVACGMQHRTALRDPPVASHYVPLATGDYTSLAWINDGWLVLNEQGSTYRLWQIRPDGSGLRLIRMPRDPACRIINYIGPQALPDGNLGFLRWCDLLGRDRTDMALVGYDLGTGRQYPLMARPLGFNPTQFTWDPTMSRGLFSVGSGLCGGIEAMTRNGVMDYPVVINIGALEYRVDRHFHPFTGDCAGERVQASQPTWSPDGSRIAFFAQSITHTNFAQLDAPWNLYLVGTGDRTAIQVLSGVQAGPLAWSPDGRWLSFVGTVAGRDPGAWLFDVANRQLRQVASGPFCGLVWSPDGSQMAALRALSPGCGHTELIVLHLG
jgi:WD40 repeat protein